MRGTIIQRSGPLFSLLVRPRSALAVSSGSHSALLFFKPYPPLLSYRRASYANAHPVVRKRTETVEEEAGQAVLERVGGVYNPLSCSCSRRGVAYLPVRSPIS